MLLADFGKTCGQSGLLCDQLLLYFAEASEEAVFAGTRNLTDEGISGQTSLRRRLHTDDLPCSEESNQVEFFEPRDQKKREELFFFYRFITRDGVQNDLNDCYTSGFHACDSRAVRAVSPLASSRLVFFAGPH